MAERDPVDALTPTTQPVQPTAPVGPGNNDYGPAKGTVTAILAQPGGPIDTAPGNPADNLQASKDTLNKLGANTVGKLTEQGDALQGTVGQAVAVQGQAANQFRGIQSQLALATSFGGQLQQITNQKATADAAMASAKVSAIDNQNAAVITSGIKVGLSGGPNDKVLDTINKTRDDLASTLLDLHSMRQVSFSDDPASWLVNHVIKIPWAENQAKDIGQNLGQLQQANSTASEALKASGIVTNAVNAVESQKTAAIAASQASADAQMVGINHMLAASNTALSAYNAGTTALGLEDKAIGTQQQGAALIGGMATKEQEATIQAIQGSYIGPEAEARITSLKQQTVNMQASLDQMLQKGENLELVGTAADAVYKALGIPGGSPGPTALRMMPAPQRSSMFNAGSSLMATGTAANQFQDGILGATPAEAYRNVVSTKIPLGQLPPGQQTLLSHIGELFTQAFTTIHSPANEATNGKVPRGSPEEFAQIEGTVDALLEKERGVRPSDGPGNKNIYATPSLNTLSTQKNASGQMLGDTNPILHAMQPLTLNGAGTPTQHATDFNEVFSTATSLVQQGKLTDEQAANSISDIAQAAKTATDNSLGFKKFAVKSPDDYRVQLKGADLTASQIFDLTNKAQVLQGLAYARTAKSIRAINTPAAIGGY